MNDVNVRSSMARVPRVFQPFLTWLTGKPLPGQEPLIRATPSLHLFTALFTLFLGAAGSAAAWTLSGVWLAALPLGWLLVVNGARKLQVMVCHQCVHHQFYGDARRDRQVCEAVSALLFIQDYESYRYDHRDLHHGKHLTTLEDPDLKFLITLGFLPGMSRAALWQRLAWTLVSPRFHGLFLLARARANFLTSPRYRRLLALAIQGSMLGVAAFTGNLAAYLIAWALPLTVVYHMASLLQFLGEHRWLRVRQPGESAQVHLARLTSGRFPGEAAPAPGLPPLQAAVLWMVWVFRMLTYHLFSRVFVLVADLPAHDWHHRHPSSSEWPNAIYARQRDLEAGCPHWAEPYSEVWGLRSSIDAVFELFSGMAGVQYTRGTSRLDLEGVLRGM